MGLEHPTGMAYDAGIPLSRTGDQELPSDIQTSPKVVKDHNIPMVNPQPAPYTAP